MGRRRDSKAYTNSMRNAPTTSLRQTRARSNLKDAPPLMKGLNHRGEAVDPLSQDPEHIPYSNVLQRISTRRLAVRRPIRRAPGSPKVQLGTPIKESHSPPSTPESTSQFPSEDEIMDCDPTTTSSTSADSSKVQLESAGRRRRISNLNRVRGNFSRRQESPPESHQASDTTINTIKEDESLFVDDSGSSLPSLDESVEAHNEEMENIIEWAIKVSPSGSPRCAPVAALKRRRRSDDEGPASGACKRQCVEEKRSPVDATNFKQDHPGFEERHQDQPRPSNINFEEIKKYEAEHPVRPHEREPLSSGLTICESLRTAEIEGPRSQRAEEVSPGIYGTTTQPRSHYCWYEQYHEPGPSCEMVHGKGTSGSHTEIHAEWKEDWDEYFHAEKEAARSFRECRHLRVPEALKNDTAYQSSTPPKLHVPVRVVEPRYGDEEIGCVIEVPAPWGESIRQHPERAKSLERVQQILVELNGQLPGN